MVQFDKNIFFALATIVGTTVGAGIFAIPYAISQSGIIPGLFYFFLLGGAVLLLHLFFGEIVLRTQGQHRLIGYAQMYLGNWGKTLITISTLVGLIGTLLAYIVLGGEFLHTIFSSIFKASAVFWSFALWAILSFFIFRGIKLIARLELAMNAVFAAIIIFIFLVALPKISFHNFSIFGTQNIFLPYGVLLFAFAGWLAIPEAVSILGSPDEKKQLKKVITLAASLVGLLYFLFAVAVVGISGQNTSKDALSGLIPALGGPIIILGAIFGVVAVASSFLVLGNYLKNALRYDYGLHPAIAAPLAVLSPMPLFLAGLREFIFTIALVGVVIGVIEGIAIVLIFRAAKSRGNREPEYSLKVPNFLLYCLTAVFILGAIFEIFYLVK